MLLGRLEALGIRPHLGLHLPLDGFDRGVGPGAALFGKAFVIDQLRGLHLMIAPFLG